MSELSRHRFARRDRRALTIGAALILPVLLLGRALPAASARNERERARVGAIREELDRAEALLASRRRDATTVAPGDGESARERWYLVAASVAPAIADLSDYLAGIARAANVDVRSTIVRGDTAFADGAARVELRLALSSDTEGVLAFLRELSAGPLLVPLRSISISQPDPATPSSEPERLTAELVVEAYVSQERGRP